MLPTGLIRLIGLERTFTRCFELSQDVLFLGITNLVLHTEKQGGGITNVTLGLPIHEKWLYLHLEK
jgi:hypothetical protein